MCHAYGSWRHAAVFAARAKRRFVRAGLLAIGAWVVACMVALSVLLRWAGLLWADDRAQSIGLDQAYHGGPAYYLGNHGATKEAPGGGAAAAVDLAAAHLPAPRNAAVAAAPSAALSNLSTVPAAA